MTGRPKEPSLLGKPIDRVDGLAKVTGQAKYSGDILLNNMAYAVLVQSTIASGTITEIDTSDALKLKGVLTVLTHKNMPRVKKRKQTSNELLLLQDNLVKHAGQNIAMVVADTLEVAREAALLVKVTYKSSAWSTELDAGWTKKAISAGSDADSARGNVEKGLAGAETKLETKFTTPTEFHNPMEPFATVAAWEGNKLTLYETTQGVFPSRGNVAEILGLPEENVRVITHYLGGGFGCKLVVWTHAILTACAARQLKRPVKLVVQRRQMFGPVGFRPKTMQEIVIGAGKDGKLKAMRHTSVNESSTFNKFVETTSAPTTVLYDCPNLETVNRVVQLNVGSPIWMRAPGDAPGSFALETAMDELAESLGIDPIELRLRNYAEKDPSDGKPWSSKSLRECYKKGAERIGWAKRTPKPRSMKHGHYLVGLGMASATHGTYRSPAAAIAELSSSGVLKIKSGTQDIGTGTYTIMSQIAAEILGLSMDKVIVELGDTLLPRTPLSGGSMTAASVGSAVHDACAALLDKLKKLTSEDKNSPLAKLAPEQLLVGSACLQSKDGKHSQTFLEILESNKLAVLDARSDSKPSEEANKYSKNSFGAQFAEVHVDPDLGTIRVARLVGAYGAGRILNAKTARSQMIGGLIFGMSMAMFEEGIIDHNLGRIINGDLEQYHLPVHADMPEFDVIFVGEDDPHINPLGAKGIGELGIAGVAAAIANAVYHATGVRVRDLPISLDKLL